MAIAALEPGTILEPLVAIESVSQCRVREIIQIRFGEASIRAMVFGMAILADQRCGTLEDCTMQAVGIGQFEFDCRMTGCAAVCHGI